MKQPTKAIICAAGLGTRFLPETKSVPKEMLPIIDRPVIQIIVEQIVAAGVTDIIIVTSGGKGAIEDHFDRNDALEATLRANGKEDKANEIQRISELANFVYLRQKGSPKGNARPILNARHLFSNDEPFFVFFADDFFRSETAWPKQLLEAYQKTGKSVISLIEVDKKDADKYGMVSLTENVTDRLHRIGSIIEKPGEENTPSTFASVGSYLLAPEIWNHLEQEKIGHGGEIGLSHCINDLAEEDKVYGCFIDGVWHDTGDQLKYIQAIVDLALEDEKIGPNLEEYLKNRLNVV